MFEVETGVPIPTATGARSCSRFAYPFEQMADGDSFWIPADEDVPAELPLKDRINRVRSRVSGQAAKVMSYATRVVEKDGRPGIRFWRVGPKTV